MDETCRPSKSHIKNRRHPASETEPTWLIQIYQTGVETSKCIGMMNIE